jgi:plasmid stability protein
MERAEREILEERLKEEHDERERFLEAERSSRLQFEKYRMAKFRKLSQQLENQ